MTHFFKIPLCVCCTLSISKLFPLELQSSEIQDDLDDEAMSSSNLSNQFNLSI